MQGKDEKQATWSVTLRPNRSLTRGGLAAVIAVVASLNLMAGLFFWLAGAWPILGFLGLDVALIWWALNRNWSAAECFEQISISGDDVTLLRRPWRGDLTVRHFNRRWLRIHLETDEARGLVGRLFLAYRDKRHEIGSFLGAEDRRSLAQELRQAFSR